MRVGQRVEHQKQKKTEAQAQQKRAETEEAQTEAGREAQTEAGTEARRNKSGRGQKRAQTEQTEAGRCTTIRCWGTSKGRSAGERTRAGA